MSAIIDEHKEKWQNEKIFVLRRVNLSDPEAII
jgi:hypothetical protein